MTKTGYFKQDESGHWYIIPKDKIDRFRELLDGIESASTPDELDDYGTAFVDEFDIFRLSEGIEDYEVTVNG